MKLQLVKGSTDVRLYLFIQDSSASTPTGLTGLLHNSAGLVCYYVRPGGSATELPLVQLATPLVTDPHLDGGFIEIDATNLPGIYRLDLSDAILASGVDSVVMMLHGATNMVPVPIEIQLISMDLNDGVRGGLTALPNVIPANNGGLPTVDANNRIVGIQGILNDFDDLNDFDPTSDEVIVGTNNDKSDYALTTANINAIITALNSTPYDGISFSTAIQLLVALGRGNIGVAGVGTGTLIITLYAQNGTTPLATFTQPETGVTAGSRTRQ